LSYSVTTAAVDNSDVLTTSAEHCVESEARLVEVSGTGRVPAADHDLRAVLRRTC